ncbi:EAL domain-containing protein [uncultured Sphingomonas sp.]|uniref:sensor domain-containing protein n=1 Tax=uncultured Sphingomonas sp. TaxID=158754 RepID=UPI0035CC1315
MLHSTDFDSDPHARPAAPPAMPAAWRYLASADPTAALSGTALLAIVPVALCMTDAEGRLTFFNDAAVALWGRTPGLGDPHASIWPITDAHGGALAPGDTALARALATCEAVHGIEALARRADGGEIYFASDATPLFDPAGALIGAIEVVTDLTARFTAERQLRDSEAHYRHAVELNPQMPWIADPHGRILHFNDRWCRFTGQTTEQALAKGWFGIANHDDLPGVLKAVETSLTTGTPLDVRFRVQTHDGTERWVRSRAYARHDDVGAIVRWYGSTEDIHDAVIAEAELAQAEERYRFAALATRDVFWDHDLVKDKIMWSEGMSDTFGHVINDDTDVGGFWKAHIHPQDRDRVVDSLDRAVGEGDARWTCEYRFRRGDGTYAQVLDCGSLLRDDKGAVTRAIGAMLDLSDRRQTEAELRLSEERLRLATAAAGLGISDFSVVDGREHWSSELRRIFGVDATTPAGPETYFAILHPDDRPEAEDQHRRAVAGDFRHGFQGLRRILRQNDGALRWIATGGHVIRAPDASVLRVLITVRDVTEEKLAQDTVAWAATHDALTGLPNKAAFQRVLEELVSSSTAPSSLLLVDLDDFKLVNDTLGHQAGDALLVEVASRLTLDLPADATVARFGGDEFVLTLPGIDNVGAVRLGESILTRLQTPCELGERTVDVRASVGVSTYPRDGGDASTLLQAADIALYSAKAAGRHAVMPFASAMRAGLQGQVSMLRLAREAIARGSITAFYQPKICLRTMGVIGAEALLRWHHPRHGIQLAGSIAAAFDDPELASIVAGVMIAAVLTDIRGWIDAGVPIGRVAINASPREIAARGYAERLLGSMAMHGVPASALEVEVTETALFGAGVEGAVAELAILRAAGVTIALDDFGTGFSSLSHLSRYPMDAIKIDRTFVAGLSNRTDRAVVEAVLLLSAALETQCVAEGVETAEQLDYLRRGGCSMAQGFLFSPAVPADRFDWTATY